MNRERDHDKERRKRELAHEAEWSDSFLPFETSRSEESDGLENEVRSENEVRPERDYDLPVIGSAPFSIENMLLRYQDYQLLAEGGQGQVYRAFDPGIGRNIAVKVLRPDRRLSSRYIERFRRESRLTGRLDHPGICPVYDVGELEDGSCYYTMKEVSGLSLQDLLNGLSGVDSVVHDGTPMLSTFSRVCEAIEFAHSRGVIHRDLKPGNIMVGLYGEVYVIDWGLAKEIGEQETSGDSGRKGVLDPFGDEQKIDMTRDGAVIGTLGYMPPEQADGRVDEVDERSDIYSLGAILYEVLSLRCPFRGVDRTQILHRVLEGDLIPVTQVNLQALISSELESVVCKAMEHDPALRYQTVRELREDIEAYLEGRVLSAARYHPGQRLQKWLMRNYLSVTVSFFLVFFLSLAWGASLWVDRIELRQQLEGEMIQARNCLERAGDVRELSQLPGLDVVGRGYGELRELSVRREGALRKYGTAARALERAIQLDPGYSEALALRRTVGDTIGWMALAARDHLMSYLAFSQLVRFGVPREKVEHRILQIERSRRAELEWKERRLEEILMDVHQGMHRPGRDSSAPLLDEYVREVLRYRDPQTVRILGKHLAGLATRSSLNSHESEWSQSDDDAVYFICRVLGWIGLPGAVDALGDWAEKSRLREGLLEGAIALCNTRSVEAVPFIEILRMKLGQNSPEWTRAEQYLDRLPEAVKDSEATEASILCSRGLRRANKGDFQGALSDFGAAIKLAPESAQLYVNRGRVYFFLKKNEESLRDFGEAIRLQPWIFEAFMNRGNTYMELGKFEKALSDFNRVLELRPGNAGAYLNRGNAMTALNRLRPAVFEYQRALRMNPRFTAALGNLGVVYLQLNENTKALQTFDGLIRIDGRDSRAFYFRGQAKERLKQPRAAMADYQEAIRIRPNDLDSAWALAQLYFADGKFADVIQYCSRVVKMNPSHLYAFQLRARAFDALERYEEACRDYGEVIRLLPESDPLTSMGVYNSRGLAALELKRFEMALRDFNHVLKSSPTNLVAQIGRGLVFHFQGRHEEAISVFSGVLEKHGNQPEALQYRGASLVVLKRFREAVKDLNRAAQISPGDSDVFYYRGVAHLGLENRVQAQKDFRKSLQIDPESRWKSRIDTYLQDDSK